jgi:predicted DNA-binding transcriptional regulator AlpA
MYCQMQTYSTNQTAKKLGITGATLSKYIKAGKVSAPKIVQTGWKNVHAWSESDIERLRKLLPKIANGRKTRYQKLREKQKAQALKPVPRKTKKKKSP